MSDAVKVHKLYRHIGDEGQKKIKQWKLYLDEITPDQLFEHLHEECKPGGSAHRSRSDLRHNTKQGNMTLDNFYNEIKRLCDLYSFSPEEHKAFHRDAFLLNLSHQGTTQQVIEQLSKEDANPSKFSPDLVSPVAKRITQGKVIFDEMQNDERNPLVPKSAVSEHSKLTKQPKCSKQTKQQNVQNRQNIQN